jgi:hypothetical protein
LPPERILILSYFSRITWSLVISFHEASTRIARRVFLPMPRDPGYAMLRQDPWLDLTPTLT